MNAADHPPLPLLRRLRPSRSQLRLLGALAALVPCVVVVFGLVAERSLQARELARSRAELEARARLVRELVGSVPLTPAERPRLDALADHAAEVAHARVTLLAADGSVVGDSDVPIERLPGIENHASRPEVSPALAGTTGWDSRLSATVGRPLLYLAIPAAGPAGGAIRVADELPHLEGAISDLRRLLVAAGALGIAVALLLSYAVSWLTLRPLRELRGYTQAIAAGDLGYRIPRRFRDELGEISRSIRDLAEQLRERVAEATREKERLRAVLDGMVEGVLVVDDHHRIVLANDRVAAFYDVRQPLQGRSVLAALRDADLDELLGAAQRTDDPVEGTLEVAHPKHRTLRVQAARFPAAPAPRLGSVAVLHDVTALARLDTMRRDFVANASHELRTPLAAIRGFTEMLLGDGPPPSEEQRRSYLEVIDRHAKRLGTLVDDLLELSRIEGGELPLELQPVDVGALVAGLLRDCEARLREKDLDAAAEGGPAVAWGNPQAVWQILSNLLDNAIKYTEAGGRIRIRSAEDARRVHVAVEDNGTGIPERDLARIFERFYRVDRARSRALGGTGLGLSIVKHLVQSQGGEITVESELGRGSTFRFSLPRAAGRLPVRPPAGDRHSLA